ncbi:MAG TPA: hypothetical protein VGP82_02475 [Ktedonobacterales bacterium]|nr:hypothetical protein [Ktedonobacterales bacterium]
MPDGSREDSQDEREFSVTALRPPRQRPRADVWRHVPLDARGWRWVAVAVSLVLALAVILSSVSATNAILGRISAVFAAPMPSTQRVSGTRGEPGLIILDEATPTPLPGVPPLGPAPRSCPQKAARPEYAGPGYGQAIGGPSVWVTGFTGAYPTLSLRGASEGSADPFGWPMHHTQFGWPAPIIIVLAHNVEAPVMLSGWDLRNGHPLWFGFALPDAGAPPPYIRTIRTSLTLDPNHLEGSASGISATDTFWDGYVFLPREGCYVLVVDSAATFTMWTAMFSAGL